MRGKSSRPHRPSSPSRKSERVRESMRLPRFVVLLLPLAPLVAGAEVLSLYGYGPRAAAMGGAMTAEATDYTAVFYNPALLVDRKEVNFGAQFHFYRMVADVRSRDLGKELDLSNANAPDSVGSSVGVVLPFPGKVADHLALGLGLYLPSEVLVQLNAPSAVTPYWYRYQANPARFTLHLGAGIRILDWLKVGAGFQVLVDVIGTASSVQVDLFSKQVKTVSEDARVGIHVAPVFALHLAPHPRLRFGLTFKGQIELKFSIPATVNLEGIGILGFTASGVAHYSPHTLNLGVAVDALKELTFTLEGEWQNWSAAPSPYVAINVDVSGRTLEALGLGTALDVSSASQRPGFADTLGARIGIEYRVWERLAARVGGFLRPTPVPKQDTAGTNLLDNTTFGVSCGLGFNFTDPLEIFQHPIQIDLAGQAHVMPKREAKKETFDPQPGYTYAANVYGGTVAIRYDF